MPRLNSPQPAAALRRNLPCTITLCYNAAIMSNKYGFANNNNNDDNDDRLNRWAKLC